MNYVLNSIIIDGVGYYLYHSFEYFYTSYINGKVLLINKDKNKIVIDVGYGFDNVYESSKYKEYLFIEKNWNKDNGCGNMGLMDSKTAKILLEPIYYFPLNTSFERLVEIYKSKMRIEKLRQLEEMV
jgi:hypothetical protein